MRGCSWVCGRCPAKRRQAVSARTGSRRPRERRLRSRSVSLLEPPGFQLYILLRQLPARVLSGSSKPQAAFLLVEIALPKTRAGRYTPSSLVEHNRGATNSGVNGVLRWTIVDDPRVRVQ